MIISWDRFKGDLFPLKIDTSYINYFVVVDTKGRLCFMSKNSKNIEFSITKRNRKKLYKLYKNGKLISKSEKLENFTEQFF
jgi:hypothetical protein